MHNVYCYCYCYCFAYHLSVRLNVFVLIYAKWFRCFVSPYTICDDNNNNNHRAHDYKCSVARWMIWLKQMSVRLKVKLMEWSIRLHRSSVGWMATYIQLFVHSLRNSHLPQKHSKRTENNCTQPVTRLH